MPSEFKVETVLIENVEVEFSESEKKKSCREIVVGRVLRLRRITHWHNHASFVSFVSILGKGGY